MKKIVLIALIALALIVAACASPTAEPTKAPVVSSSSSVASSVAPTAVPATKPPAPTTAPSSSSASSSAASSSVAVSSASSAASSAAGKPLKVGLMTDRTGALAIYGPMLENGFALGLEYATGGTNTVGGRPIQVITKDTASKVDVGTQVARDLIEKENVDILVGVPSSGVALAVNELAKQYKKIYIAQPAAGTEITGKNFNPYVFRTSRSNEQDALASGAALLKLGKTFVQIAPDYAFGYGSATGFYNVVKAGGGKFPVNDDKDKVGTIYIPQDAKDFTPYLQKVLDAKAEVLIVTWAGAGFVPLFQQMQQLGVFKAMTVYTGVGDNQTLKAGYADAVGAKGVNVYHYTNPKNPVNDWLVQNHIAKFKNPPDLFTEGGFTAAQMLVAGLKATNGDPDPGKLIKAYESSFSFDGPKGKYSVRPYDHVMLQTMYVVEIANVTDPEFKYVKLVTEIKPDEVTPSCTLEGDFKSRCPAK
ncbi:MAG: substrate-binding domain-containing protein [Chloroflexi bacterium]|nr:substrate-binding domain-containing protein [Chloroflexota bacterium]